MKTCSTCQVEKPKSAYYTFTSKGKYSYLKAECKDCTKKRSMANFKAAGETAKARKAKRNAEWWQENGDKHRAAARAKHHARKLEVLRHYSQGQPKCACCSEDTIEFLSIDHIKGGGSQHRKAEGFDIYRILKRDGFPEGYQCSA